MSTSYSANLALALPATGELSGTWGTTVNSNITNMLDEALGYQAFSATGGADTLTIPDGTTGVARSIYIQLNGTGGGSVAVPATKTKMYFVFNNTASAITFKVTGQTGVSIPAAAKMALVSNGTDIIVAQNYFAALTLGAALPVLSGGTGVTTSTGTGSNVLSASPTLTGTVAGASLSLSSLTSGRVTYAGASGLLQDSANLLFNGTTLTANTIGAFTLAGTVAGGGNQLNNVIIGTTTPLAGAFTTLSASPSGSTSAVAVGTVSGYGVLSFNGGAASLSTSSGVIGGGGDPSIYLAATTGASAIARVGGANIGVFSSTGLAVTGALSATGNLTLGSAGAGNGFINSTESILINIDSNNDQTNRVFTVGCNTTDGTGTQLFSVTEAGAFSITGTLSVAKTTGGDAFTWSAGTKTGFLYGSNGGVGIFAGAASSNTGIGITLASNTTIYSPDQTKTLAVSDTGTAVTGTLSVGSGASTSAGLIIGYNGSAGYGSIWSTAITPSASNYSLVTNGGVTYLNGSSTVALTIGATPVATATSTGLAVTGTTSIGSGTALGTVPLDVHTLTGVCEVGIYANSNASATAHAQLRLYSGGASGGDPIVNWEVTGGSRYYMGIDNSNSDKLVIGSGYNPGASDYLTIDATGLAVTGALGVGGAANAGIGLYVQNAALTGTSQYAIYAQAIATSASTTAIYGALLQPRTAAASFTVANSYGLFLPDAVKGAGSAITNQYALYIEDQVQGTSNFGIRSVVSSGTNKYNLYISGTAINYFAGDSFVGKTASALATAGIELQAVGFLAVTRAERPFVLNRLTTDGDLIELYRDSVSKATIGITTNNLTFGVGGAEKMRLVAAGDLLVGTTSAGLSGVTIYNAAGNGNVGRVDIAKSASGASTAMTFRYVATAVGSISYTDVATSFNTSSDYRLKDNIQNAPDVAELIDAIQVRQFHWKAGGSHQRYGFIAQELVTVAPEAVYTPADPDEMMAVDYSKLVPLLVKELQSLRARVAQLESKP